MPSLWMLWTAISYTARLSFQAQVLILLPLSLATLPHAFPLLSFLLNISSIIHGTLLLLFPRSGNFLSVLQAPVPSLLILFSFNTFYLAPFTSLMSFYENLLTFFGPFFMILEALASLVVVQKIGKEGQRLVGEGEGYQLSLLVAAASAYVVSAMWLYLSFEQAATSPLSSTFLGVALTALIFITIIGFTLRRTNIIETSGLSLVIAYNVWLCGFNQQSFLDPASSYNVLLPNSPYLQFTNFIINTLPRPILIALVYRLTILHLASRILPTIGGDNWDSSDTIGQERPTLTLTRIILTYRQAIFVTVYSHLLTLDHSTQLWWRWASIFFTLVLWIVEMSVSSDDEMNTTDWKMD